MRNCKTEISHQRELILLKMVSGLIYFGKNTVTGSLQTSNTLFMYYYALTRRWQRSFVFFPLKV